MNSPDKELHIEEVENNYVFTCMDESWFAIPAHLRQNLLAAGLSVNGHPAKGLKSSLFHLLRPTDTPTD